MKLDKVTRLFLLTTAALLLYWLESVIGLPGDEIDIVENEDDEDVYDLYVNGEYLETTNSIEFTEVE